jgi:hypothetical protein
MNHRDSSTLNSNSPMTTLQEYLSLLAGAEVNTLPPVEAFKMFLTCGNNTNASQDVLPVSPLPELHPFTILEGVTIESAKEGLPMSVYCQEHLTNINYGTDLPSGSIQGGFLSMGHNYESEEAVSRVTELVRQTGCKFRLGTPLELLLYKTQNLPCPTYVVSLAKVWNGFVLHWRGWHGDSEFDLGAWKGEWNAPCEVFVVEDLES